jgi:hypothetical protein
MKPHTIKGRTKLPAESGRLSPAEHILERIQTLTAELQAVQTEIDAQVSDPAEMLARRMFIQHQGSAQVLEHFRTALDQIRGVLWLCAQEAADFADPQRRHQLARAGGLLRTLSANARADAASSRHQPREAVSFFDRLDRVIDNYMQEGGSIVDPVPGKRPKH